MRLRGAAALVMTGLLTPAAGPAQGGGGRSGLVVEGRVVADAAGAPLAGARVELAGTALSTVTSPDRTFAIELPAAGPFSLRAVLDGYEDGSGIDGVGRSAWIGLRARF